MQKETLDTNYEKVIEIAKNLELYKSANRFQKSVSLFISNLHPSMSEVKSLRQFFMLIDKNRDGKLSLAEL